VQRLHKFHPPNSGGIVFVVLSIAWLSLPLSSCAPAPQFTAAPTLAAIPSATNAPTIAPTATVANPYHLSDTQIARLGNSTQPFVASRSVVLQRFANGVMLVFAKSDKGFDASGGEFIFALTKDGRAWRIADTFVETSKNPDSWYTCDAKPGLRPERSGVPWRGFGKAWCDHPEVRAALGNARSYEESEIDASFQAYAMGRAFQLSDWRGIPGWNSEQVYVVLLGSSAPDFASGRWE
jgi:hypothetical protein